MLMLEDDPAPFFSCSFLLLQVVVGEVDAKNGSNINLIVMDGFMM